jgi:Zn finger protein HypA/HybF involved in hydrogenase expression
MHEGGIVTRMLEAALARAAQAGATRITALELELGSEAGVDRDSIAFHWPLLSAGTIAEGAALRIRGSHDPRAMRLRAIDVDDGPEAAAGGGLC